MCPWEAIGTCTKGCHRGTGPGALRKIHRDNVGKNHLPAGAGSNLQRRAGLGNSEACERVVVRRMSQYELRRRGNSLPGGRPGCPEAGNACSSGKEALGLGGHADGEDTSGIGPSGSTVPLQCRRAELTRQTRSGRGVCAPALEPRRIVGRSVGKCQAPQPESGKPTFRDDNGSSGKRGRRASGIALASSRRVQFYPNALSVRFRTFIAACARSRVTSVGSVCR